MDGRITPILKNYGERLIIFLLPVKELPYSHPPVMNFPLPVEI